MKNGTSTKVKNEARDNPRLVVDKALEIWNERVVTANTSGKKLQQGAFTIMTEDGETAWMVRPLQSGLKFYTEAPFEVKFERPVVEVTTNIVGLEPSQPEVTDTKGKKKK